MKSLSKLNRELISAGAWHFLPRGIRIISAILGASIVARHLGPKDFGALNIYYNIVLTVASLLSLGAPEVLTRAVAASPTSGIRSLKIVLQLRLLGFFLCSILLFGIGHFLANKLLLAILSLIPLFFVFDTIESYFYGAGDFRKTVVARIVASLIGLLMRIYFAWEGWGINAFAVAAVIEAGVAALGLLWLAPKYRMAIPDDKNATLANYIKLSWPLAVSGLVLAFSLRVDQYLLAYLRKGPEIGNYYVAVRIMEFASLIIPSMSAVLLPKLVVLYENKKDEYEKAIVSIYKNSFLWGTIFACLFSAFSPALIKFVFGDTYAESALILRYYSFCIVFMIAGTVRGMHLVITNNTVVHLQTCLICLALSPITMAIPIHVNGALGLAMAMPLNYAFSSTISSRFFKVTRGDWRCQILGLREAIEGILIKARLK
jgi:O-antigen/teichoic acid export membrane protein